MRADGAVVWLIRSEEPELNLRAPCCNWAVPRAAPRQVCSDWRGTGISEPFRAGTHAHTTGRCFGAAVWILLVNTSIQVPVASQAVPARTALNSSTAVELISAFLSAAAYGYIFLRSANLILQAPPPQREMLGAWRGSKWALSFKSVNIYICANTQWVLVFPSYSEAQTSSLVPLVLLLVSAPKSLQLHMKVIQWVLRFCISTRSRRLFMDKTHCCTPLLQSTYEGLEINSKHAQFWHVSGNFFMAVIA